MTLDQIIEIADNEYGDGLVEEAYRTKRTGLGDSLALFIAQELEETHEHGASDADQLWEAYRVMRLAKVQITDLEEAFENLAVEAQRKEYL